MTSHPSHPTTSIQSLARWDPLHTHIHVQTLMNTSHTHWHGRCWPQVLHPLWPLHLLMRGQRLRVAAESVRPRLHTSWDTHTPVRRSNSHSTVRLSRPFSAPEKRVDYWTFLFSAHIHAQTHTHTARESTDPLSSAECFPRRWSKWSSLTLQSACSPSAVTTSCH